MVLISYKEEFLRAVSAPQDVFILQLASCGFGAGRPDVIFDPCISRLEQESELLWALLFIFLVSSPSLSY